MRLADYLPTRVVELGIHTLDLQGATVQPLTLPRLGHRRHPGRAGRSGRRTDVLLLALTGRRPLPAGFNVLG